MKNLFKGMNPAYIPKKDIPKSLKEVMVSHIASVVNYCHGNASEAAKILKINRNTVAKHLKGK